MRKGLEDASRASRWTLPRRIRTPTWQRWEHGGAATNLGANMGIIERLFGRQHCAACGRWRKPENLEIYLTRKLTDDGYVDFALNYCNDRFYCNRKIVKVPKVGI